MAQQWHEICGFPTLHLLQAAEELELQIFWAFGGLGRDRLTYHHQENGKQVNDAAEGRIKYNQ
jgi:hypothetical protein